VPLRFTSLKLSYAQLRYLLRHNPELRHHVVHGRFAS
jgi:hypothetical protein